MKSFCKDINEKNFTSMPRACSRYIYGYKTIKGEQRYRVNVKGVAGSTHIRYADAVKERDYILKNIIDW